jgi:hypothetical protein
VYELVLKAVFEIKIRQVETSSDIPPFKKLKNNWGEIYYNKIQCHRETVESFLTGLEIEKLLAFYLAELNNVIIRKDYRELIELSIVFLGGDKEEKIRPPGAMHQARWMARAIYSLKISLFSSQLELNTKEKVALLEVCLFIVTTYVKPWLQCILAVKAPYQNWCFLKSLKVYENVDESISKAALHKFCQHLWYLTEEVAVLTLFDNDVSQETKEKIVANLNKESFSTHEKRYIPSKEKLCGSLYG